MSAKVKKIETSSLWTTDCVVGKIKCKRLIAPLVVTLFGAHNTDNIVVRLKFDVGFACDGLSVPRCFRWFLKNWDDENELYNIAGIVHDALYGNKGFKVFSRSECDDIFRGILRESGKDRKHASIADWCVGTFAGSHWGDDSLYSAHLVRMELKNA